MRVQSLRQGITVLAADVANAEAVANTMTDVTGLNFPVLAATRYKFRFVIVFSAAATTTGCRWSVNGPATPTLLGYRATWSTGVAAEALHTGLGAYNLPAASSTTSAVTAASNVAIVEGIIIPSAAGTVQARFASEITVSAITAKAGSYVEWEKLA